MAGIRNATRETTSSKPLGGFRLITTTQICMVWSAYRTGLLKNYRDLRVYFALHEVAERRAAANRRRRTSGLRQACFRLESNLVATEVHVLVGGAGGPHVRGSLRRLERSGLVAIRRDSISFASSLDALPPDATKKAAEMLNRLDRRKRVSVRRVPLPRSVVRFLARDTRPGVAAAILGHAIRCVWLRGGRLTATGSCAASFISRVFGIHVRTAKRARSYLCEVNWLEAAEADDRHVRRFGARLRVNLNWKRPTAPPCRPSAAPESSGLPPSEASAITGLPPAVRNHHPLPGSHNHHPKCRKPDGVCRLATSEQGIFPLPRLYEADLRNDGRLRKLHQSLVRARWVTGSEADRLHVFAAAEHALRLGDNPCGLFIWLVRNARWEFLSQEDEDRGRQRLARPQRGTEDPLDSGVSCTRLKRLVDRVASRLAVSA